MRMQALGIQVVSLVGAILILVAYVGHQLECMRPQSVYNLMNAAGLGILAYIAFRPFQIGFIIMETSWVIISLYALLRARRADTSGGRT